MSNPHQNQSQSGHDGNYFSSEQLLLIRQLQELQNQLGKSGGTGDESAAQLIQQAMNHMGQVSQQQESSVAPEGTDFQNGAINLNLLANFSNQFQAQTVHQELGSQQPNQVQAQVIGQGGEEIQAFCKSQRNDIHASSNFRKFSQEIQDQKSTLVASSSLQAADNQIVDQVSTVANTEIEAQAATTPDDEDLVRNHPKIAFICQFLQIFRSVMKVQVSKNFITEEIVEMQEKAYQAQYGDNYLGSSHHQQKLAQIQKVDKLITPFDIEHSILRPQLDPLVGDIVTRLLQKNCPLKNIKPITGSAVQRNQRADGEEDKGVVQSQSYEQWNTALAKKFSVMFKKYAKFRLSMMKHEEDQEITKVLEEKDREEEQQNQDKQQNNQENSQNQLPTDHQIQEVKNADEKEGAIEKDDRIAEENPEVQDNKSEKVAEEVVEVQDKKGTENNEGGVKVDGEGGEAGRESGEANVVQQAPENQKNSEKSEFIPDVKYRGDYPVSHSLNRHILSSNDCYIFSKFEHDQSATWKTDQLQLVKLFEQDLGGIDPFYIEGQEELLLQKKENEKAKQKENIYLNYVHTEAIEDIDGQYHLADPGNESKNEIQIKYKQFHELPIHMRIDILFYLCQTRLDQESPEFIQEIFSIQAAHKQKQQEVILREKEKEKMMKEKEKQKQKQAQKAQKQKAKGVDSAADATTAKTRGSKSKDQGSAIASDQENTAKKENEEEQEIEMDDPYSMLVLEPFAELEKDIKVDQFEVPQGRYFCIEQFGDARILRQDPTMQAGQVQFGDHKVLCKNIQEIGQLYSNIGMMLQLLEERKDSLLITDFDIQQLQKMFDYIDANQQVLKANDEQTIKNLHVRSRKLQSVCRLQAYHERLKRKQAERQIITGQNHSHGRERGQISSKYDTASALDPNKGTGGDMDGNIVMGQTAGSNQIAEKKRLDRAARLDRRKQIQRGEIIQDSQINSGAGGPDQTFLSSSHLGGAGGSKSYQKHKQMEMHEQMPGRSAGYASGEEGADEYKQTESEASEEMDMDSDEEEYVNGRYRKVTNRKAGKAAGRGEKFGGLSKRGPQKFGARSSFEGANKRQKIAMGASGSRGLKFQTTGGMLTDFFSDTFPMLSQQNQKNKFANDPDEQTIELQGSLLLIYKRNKQNQHLIDSLNIVLKGQWKIKGNQSEPQDFIYKKSWSPQVQDSYGFSNQQYLKELFCDQDANSSVIDSNIGAESTQVIDLNNDVLMLSKLFQSQGLYEGYFNYKEQQVSESFNILLKKKNTLDLFQLAQGGKNARISIVGFGENSEMGSFMLDGYCEVQKLSELQEKEGLKVEQQENNEPMFMKLKLAKFIIFKKYQNFSLRQLVEHKREFNKNKANQNMEANQIQQNQQQPQNFALSALEQLIKGSSSNQDTSNQQNQNSSNLLQQLQQVANDGSFQQNQQASIGQNDSSQLQNDALQLLNDLFQQQQQQIPGANQESTANQGISQNDLALILQQLQGIQGFGSVDDNQGANTQANSNMQTMQNISTDLSSFLLNSLGQSNAGSNIINQQQHVQENHQQMQMSHMSSHQNQILNKAQLGEVHSSGAPNNVGGTTNNGLDQFDQSALIEQLVHQQVQEHLKQQMKESGLNVSQDENMDIDPQLIQAIVQQVQSQMQSEAPKPQQPHHGSFTQQPAGASAPEVASAGLNMSQLLGQLGGAQQGFGQGTGQHQQAQFSAADMDQLMNQYQQERKDHGGNQY